MKIIQFIFIAALCLSANLNCLFVLLGDDDSAPDNLLSLFTPPGAPPNPAGTSSGDDPGSPPQTPPTNAPSDGGTGGGGPDIPAPRYNIRVTITGLAGTGLILRDHVNRELAAGSDGSYNFPIPRADGESFAIEVKQRPTGPSQYCRIRSGTGQISGADALVDVRCMDPLRMLGNINHNAVLVASPKEVISSNNEVFFVATDSDREHTDKLWSLRGTEPYPIPEFYSRNDIRQRLSNIVLLKERNGTVFFRARSHDSSYSLYAVTSEPDSLEWLGLTSTVAISGDPFTGDNRLLYTRKVDDLNIELRSFRNGYKETITTFTSGYTASYSTLPRAQYFKSMNGIVYFRVRRFDWGSPSLWTMSLWRTDGTAAGTYRLRVMRSEDHGGFVRLGNELYFMARDEPPGARPALWKTNGTIAGTVHVLDLPHNPKNLIASGNKLFFSSAGSTGSTQKIWVSDGTAAGTRVVTETSLPAAPAFRAYDGSVYFVRGSASPAGLQLLRCDENGLTVIKNDLFGDRTTFHYLKDALVVNGLLFFIVGKRYSSATDNVVWRTNGTPAGTFRVGVDLNPGERLVPYQSGVLFPGSDSTTSALFYSDGVDAQTTRLFSNYIGANSSPSTAAQFGDLTFFTANDGAVGREPWITDGTLGGTGLLRDIIPGNHANPVLPTNAGSRLFFFAKAPSTRRIQLWLTDGSPAGTKYIQEFTLNSTSGTATFAMAHGSNLIFALDHDTFGNELWYSDGTAAGTRLIRDMDPNRDSAYPAPLGFLDSRMIFSARAPGYGRELWVLDSSANTVELLKDIYPGGPSSQPVPIAATADTLFFTAQAPGSGKELWKTDGTTASTTLVKEITPGSGSTEIYGAIVFNSKLFFVTDTPAHGRELWVSDGTSAGTRPLKDIAIGSDGSYPHHLTVFKGMLYFSASNSEHGRELWRSDGTEAGTNLVKDIAPGSHGSSPGELTVAGDYIYFSAGFGTGSELWLTDGSEAGTMLLRDIRPGTSSSNPAHLTAVGDKLVFTATAGTDDGLELWQSDGTPAGTFRVNDIRPGPMDSNPQFLSVTPDGILFSARDGVHGRELWIYNP